MSGIYIPGFFVPRKTGIVSIVLSGDGSALLCEDGAYKEIKVIPVPAHKGPLVDALEVINTFPEEFIFTEEQARALTNYIITVDKEGEE
jgi:hypothetical protein